LETLNSLVLSVEQQKVNFKMQLASGFTRPFELSTLNEKCLADGFYVPRGGTITPTCCASIFEYFSDGKT
jgi:hypothetical protein